ncbi:MAG: TonB-dependent receptor [Bacteroidota bacterium]|nr:TonB-dependent receptor [Bacteroidota bacterium]
MRKLLALLTAFLLFAGQLFAQKTISGKVTDDKGNPIANASVVVKGTSTGTVTKADGTYTITVPANAKILVFSSVDLAPEEITIGSQTTINTSLKSADKTMAEVVVVGYGTQKRSDVTSSVTKIGGDKVANVPMTSVDQILQGKAAGVQSVTFSGQPGANQQIRIRGVGSFAASSQPLFVIDGIQVNSGDVSRETTTSNVLASLNPDDIESISILKDAAATSIYGARGSNGVILINTKRGKAGKTQFKFTAEVGQNTHGDIPSAGMPLRADDWAALYKESYINAGGSPANADANLLAYGYPGGSDIDWLSLITRKGAQQQYNISASGGDQKTKFYISGGYFKQEANVIGSDLKRFSSVINLDHTVSNKLSFAFSLQPTFIRQNTPLSNSSAFSNPVMEFSFLRPLQNPYNADGSLNISTATKDFGSLYNPLYIVGNDIHSLNDFTANTKAEGKYNILDNLSFTTRMGMQYINFEEYYYNNPFHGDGKAANGRGYAYNTRYFLYDWTNQLDYRVNLTRNKDLNLNATVGYEAISSKGYFVSAQSQNFPTSSLTYAAVASSPTIGNNSASDYTFASEFARAALNYKGKYILQGSFRRDGSSRFSQKNEYGNFPAGSIAWNVNKENFMSDVKFISDLKLRFSYGSAGNAEIGNYAWRQTLGYGLNYNNQPGGGFNNIGNDELQWEASKQTNAGIDVSFLKNRLNLNVDYYKRKIDKLIFPVPTSQTIGFSSISKNLGAMQNSGLEVTINATPIAIKDFTWDISFNFSHNKNKMVTLPAGQYQVINGSFVIRPGQDFYTFYLRDWAGVNSANGDPLWYTDSTHSATTNNYNAALRVAGNKTATPKYFGGLSNSLTYKGFNLTFDFYYNYGNYVQDGWAAYFYDEVNPSYGKYTYNLQRWQKPGDVTNVPKLVYGSSNFSSSASTRFLYKGDFIRLRNVSIGYTAPTRLVEKLHLSSFNFYIRGTNLWTKVYDKNIPFDPEQNINSQSNLNVFYNKSVTVGVNIGF